jgi:lipoprotein-releasing system permease protein
MIFLAFRQLLTRRRQTLLTLLGIILGTTAYVAISGLMLGFQQFIIEQLVNNDSHIRVSSRQDPVDSEAVKQSLFPEDTFVDWIVKPSGRRESTSIINPTGWFDRLNNDPRVATYSEQLVVQALITKGGVARTARIVGSNPEKQEMVTNIEKYMTHGHFKDANGGSRMIIGGGLLNRIGANVGDSILVSAGKGDAMSFKIVGSFFLGVSSIDDTTAFVHLGDAQKLNRTPSKISDIAVRLFNVGIAAEIATNWARTSIEKVQSWDQANTGILSVFTTQDIVRNSMTVSILIVAGFGIYNILNMVVNQKRKEIGILRSMGFESSDIITLFLIQGLVLGFAGGIIGIVIGHLACRGIALIPVSKDRLGNGTMMMSYDTVIYVKGFFLAFGSALVASFLPARNAGRLTPIDIIRSEGT